MKPDTDCSASVLSPTAAPTALFAKTATAMIAVYLSTACSATAPKFSGSSKTQLTDIIDDYVLLDITPENIGQSIANCLSQIASAESINRNKQKYTEYLKKTKPNRISVVAHHSNSNTEFIYEGETGVCINKTNSNLPILPAGSVVATVNPKGVPDKVSIEWYKLIALDIANRSESTVAYKFPNGNATIATYWVNGPTDVSLSYESSFQFKGKWEGRTVDHVFSHPLLRSVSSTKYNGRSVKIPRFGHLRSSPSTPEPVQPKEIVAQLRK